MEEILADSELIKDDHIQVFKYQETYIIKKIPYSDWVKDYLIIEKDFLINAKKEWIDIHLINKIIFKEDSIYVFYNYIKSEWEIDFFKVGQNFKKLHEMENKYDFPYQYSLENKFIKSRIILKSLLWKEILNKWDYIKKDVIENYWNEVQKRELNTIVHWDFNIWNIVAPNIIIDTEQILIWIPEMDISSFYRLWYRFWDKTAMRQLLLWYWYDKDIEYIKPFLFYKDFRSTIWTIINNKWDKWRISEIENRINNWYNLDNKWVLY